MEKTGYYEIKSLNRITFNNTGNGSSKDNPVLFHLRKKGAGADLITSQYGVSHDFTFSIPRDGSQVKIDLMQRKMGDTGQMRISQTKPEYANWKLVSRIIYNFG